MVIPTRADFYCLIVDYRVYLSFSIPVFKLYWVTLRGLQLTLRVAFIFHPNQVSKCWNFLRFLGLFLWSVWVPFFLFNWWLNWIVVPINHIKHILSVAPYEKWNIKYAVDCNDVENGSLVPSKLFNCLNPRVSKQIILILRVSVINNACCWNICAYASKRLLIWGLIQLTSLMCPIIFILLLDTFKLLRIGYGGLESVRDIYFYGSC
jgi:hypothetical protein